ncbi:MAG: hypothetical protein AAGM84_08115 [Pseudomonadota bacterium]
MSIEYIGIITLAMITFGAVLFFALRSKAEIEERMDDPNAGKSTLAADKSSTGKPVDV